MNTMDFNPITASFAIKQDQDYRSKIFEDSIEVAKSDLCDLVFICEDERVSYHSELVSIISPVVREFVQNAKSCQCSSFIKRQVELFITLDGVHASVLELVLSSVYGNRQLTIPKTDLEEVSKILKMLGVEGNQFRMENPSKTSDIGRSQFPRPQFNSFKRRVPESREDVGLKRIKSINTEENEGGRQTPAYNTTRAEQILSDHKSITMTKVAPNPAPPLDHSTALSTLPLSISSLPPPAPVSNLQPSVSNLPPSRSNLPPSLSNLPVSVNSVPPSPSMNEAPGPFNFPSSLSSLSSSTSNLPSSITNLPSSISILPSSSGNQTGDKIRGFLPHLSISTSGNQNQDNFENRNVEPRNNMNNAENMFEDNEPMLHENVNSDEYGSNRLLIDQGDLKCPIAYCPMGGRSFKMRSEIIMHIAHEHYKEQLLELHPWNRGASCQLCIDEQRPKIYQIPPNKKSHIMHVGVTHEVIMDLVPPELKVALEAFGPKKRGAGGRPKKKSFIQDNEGGHGSFSHRDSSYQNNSYSNPYEDNQSEQVYDDYNYDGSTSYNYQELPLAPIAYEGPYDKENHPYQENTNPYGGSYQEPMKAIENEPHLGYGDMKPQGGYNDLKSQGTIEETKTVNEPSNDDENLNIKVEGKQQEPLPQNDEPEHQEHPTSEGEERNLSRFRNSQIAQGMPRKPRLQGHLTCHLCTMRSFPKKDDLMFHLTFSHFSKDLLQKHPFVENQECSLCGEDSIRATTMSAHLRHVGVQHGLVLQFLTPDIAEQIGQDDVKQSIPPSSNPSKIENTAVVKTEPVELEHVKNSVADKQEMVNGEEVRQDAVKDNPVNMDESRTEQKPIVDTSSVQCSLCPNKVRMYNKRSDFLKHLSLGHYGRNILQVHPYQQGQNCVVCHESNSKVFVPTKKEIHVCHVGVLHGKVFEYLSDDVLSLVKSLPTQKKIAIIKSPMKDVKIETSVPEQEQTSVQDQTETPVTSVQEQAETRAPEQAETTTPEQAETIAPNQDVFKETEENSEAQSEAPTEATLQEEVAS